MLNVYLVFKPYACNLIFNSDEKLSFQSLAFGMLICYELSNFPSSDLCNSGYVIYLGSRPESYPLLYQTLVHM